MSPRQNPRDHAGTARRVACALIIAFAAMATSDDIAMVAQVQPSQVQQAGPSCGELDAKLWIAARESLGIFVTDEKRQIGGAVGNVKFSPQSFVGRIGNAFVGGYTPVSGFKEMACGKLRKFSLFKGLPPELDLHQHIALSPAFRHIAIGTGNGECHDCVWGEVTPPTGFTWFWTTPAGKRPKSGDNDCDGLSETCGGKALTLATGGNFCLYGPWVVEAAHGNRPEIHPVQAFWGQSTLNHTSLHLVDDWSDRFQLRKYFTETQLSAAFAPWSGDQRLVLSKVVRIPANQTATLNIKDDGPYDAGLPKETIRRGSSQLELTRPKWLPFTVTHGCQNRDGSAQLILEASVRLEDKTTWRSLDFWGSNTGITYGKASQATDSASTPTPGDKEEERWALHSVLEWSEPVELVRRSWARSAAAWRVNPERTAWTGIPRQRLVVEVLPTTLNAPKVLLEDPRASWTLTMTDLETNRAVPLNEVPLRLEYPRDVPTTLSEGVRHIKTRHKNAFALVIEFPPIWSNDRRAHLRNLKVNVTARITDQHETREVSTTLYSIVPNFLGAVAGYDVHRRSGAFPEVLTDLFVPWLRELKCDITRADFKRELDGQLTTPSHVPELRALIHPRVRNAGIMRQAVNMALRDRTIDANEYLAIRYAATEYSKTCQPSVTW